MDKQTEMKSILEKYLAGKASSEEQALLETWYLQYPLDGRAELPQLLADQDLATVELVLRNLSAKIEKRKLWPRWAAAAAILLVIGASLFYFNNVSRFNNSDNYLNNATHITPGKNTATLTLANGKTINLSDTKTGVIIEESKLTYNDGSKVRVSSNEHPSNERPAMNDRHQPLALQNGKDQDPALASNPQLLTASTPRGGQYTITLPDGTKVWLNAESSIKFPSTFSGLPNRTVELFGEAYFEVSKVYTASKKTRIPFIVKTNNQELEVLGTHFNISSYTNEATKTTLLEGSVKVSSSALPSLSSSINGRHPELVSGPRNRTAIMPGQEIILKPNQQSTLSNGTLKVKSVDPDFAIAWKNGDFMFEDETIDQIMDKVARWYNVQIQYQGEKPVQKYNGIASRGKNVSQILSVLERTGTVHFNIEGRKIIVTK